MSADVRLLHTMTGVEIARWCQTHGMFVQIDWTTDKDGFLVPIISARRQIDPNHLPAFLQRQAD